MRGYAFLRDKIGSMRSEADRREAHAVASSTSTVAGPGGRRGTQAVQEARSVDWPIDRHRYAGKSNIFSGRDSHSSRPSFSPPARTDQRIRSARHRLSRRTTISARVAANRDNRSGSAAGRVGTARAHRRRELGGFASTDERMPCVRRLTKRKHDGDGTYPGTRASTSSLPKTGPDVKKRIAAVGSPARRRDTINQAARKGRRSHLASSIRARR